MRYFYISDLVKNEEVQVNWNPGQENLGDYASKHHYTKHHQQVRIIYLHKANSLRVCVGTILGGYVCGRPLPMYKETTT